MPFLEKYLKSAGIKITHKTGFMPDERDFKIETVKIVKSNPDILFLYANEPGMTLFTEQLRQSGYNGPMTSSGMFVYSAHPEVFEGQEFADLPLGGTDDFVKKYLAQFNEMPKSLAPAQYDNIMLMHLLAEKFGAWSDWDAADVEPRLREVIKDYSGANGKLHINAHGIIYSAPVMKVMQNGKPVPVKE
jgi:ABC-type branched-subunit amino acid transport system substrate-binding protein